MMHMPLPIETKVTPILVNASKEAFVVMLITTVHGIFQVAWPADAAEKIAKDFTEAAKTAKGGIIVPPPVILSGG